MSLIRECIIEELNNLLQEKNAKGEKKFVDHDKEKVNNPNIASDDEIEIRKDMNNDVINVAAMARKVFPNHTPEGAQSQLRKQIKGLKSDSGSEYHIKQKTANIIRKELGKI